MWFFMVLFVSPDRKKQFIKGYNPTWCEAKFWKKKYADLLINGVYLVHLFRLILRLRLICSAHWN